MSIDKKIIFTVGIGLALGISSCKKFLNVNTNPNISPTATVQELLPAAQLYLGTAQGVDLEIDGSFFAQYWTQNPGASQYHNLDQYAPGQDGFSTPWTNLYTANENFFQVSKIADSMKYKNYMAISLIMQAYTFQLITDGWGDVPFKQALKAQYADGHLVNPQYDKQMVIYDSLLIYLDSANAYIAEGSPVVPTSDDLIYGGDMTKWQKLSNTLALRILMRMSQISPSIAQAGIAALYATNPQFIGIGDDALIAYGFNTANKNPLYAEASSSTLASTQNLVASSTCVDSMNSNIDPRVYVFYEVAPAVGVVAGIPQGQYNVTPPSGTVSIPNVYVGGDAQNSLSTNAPVNLLTSYESLFLQAEVVARGWAGTPGTDKAIFDSAIKANFLYYNSQFFAATGSTGLTNYTAYIDSGKYWTLYPATGSIANKLSYIITQKWFAMCGNQGFEAWTEWRRTGYPNFFTISQSSIIGNVFPKRFTYPTSESTVNSSYPGLVPLTTNVWWDVL